MDKDFSGDAGNGISQRAQKSLQTGKTLETRVLLRRNGFGARVVPLPKWMVYAREKVRPVLEAEASRRPKGPSRTYEYTLRTSYEKAVKEYGYEGTEHDWFYLLKYAQLPGDPPNPNRGKKWYHP